MVKTYIPTVEQVHHEWQLKDIARLNRKEICKTQGFDCKNCWRRSCDLHLNFENKRILN